MTLPWPEKSVPFCQRLVELDAPLEDEQFSDVRHAVQRALGERAVGDDAQFSTLFGITELGSNANRLHILKRIVVGLSVERENAVAVYVQDTLPGWTSEADREPTGQNDIDEYGRGTDALELLATDYGYKPLVSLVKGHPEPPGKTVWLLIENSQQPADELPTDLAA